MADSRDRPGTLGNESPADVAEEQFRARLRSPDGSSPAGTASSTGTVAADTPVPSGAGTGQPETEAGGGKTSSRQPTYRSESGFAQSLS